MKVKIKDQVSKIIYVAEKEADKGNYQVRCFLDGKFSAEELNLLIKILSEEHGLICYWIDVGVLDIYWVEYKST